MITLPFIYLKGLGLITMHNYIEYFDNLPLAVITTLMFVFGLMQAIGELLELKGRVVPEFMKIRKYFKRRKEEKEVARQMPEMLAEVRSLLNDVNCHYSSDNISKRDAWMGWVNHRAEVYDNSIAELEKKLDKNNEITLSLLIDNKRNFIIDFSSKYADISCPVTKEQYKRFFKVHEEYERLIEENGMTNGEVDVAYRLGVESYEERIKKHAFIEDIRGYNTVV